MVEQYGPVQYYALAQIHAMLRKADPYHLVFGTVACRVMWMWKEPHAASLRLTHSYRLVIGWLQFIASDRTISKDSYGSAGLGLDVTMAEACVWNVATRCIYNTRRDKLTMCHPRHKLTMCHPRHITHDVSS